MSDSVFEFRSFLVCDDVRREASGKEILIGVYSDAMVFPAFPATVRNLVFRIGGVVLTDKAVKIVFKLEDQNGKDRGHAEGDLPPGVAPRFVVFNFGFENVAIEQEMALIASFGIDGDVRKVGAISARLPNNEQERARTSLCA